MRKEYTEDKDIIPVRFEVALSTPAYIDSFEIYYNQRKIEGERRRGNILTVSFVEKLPSSLVKDILEKKEGSEQYAYGYVFNVLSRINEEMLRQRYELGHFLVNTFSLFDILEITLEDLGGEITSQVFGPPMPQSLAAPPHELFTKGGGVNNPPVFIKDYIDAWADFFRGDYDNCIRKVITSIENAFTFYKLKPKRKSFLRILPRSPKGSKFIGILTDLFGGRSFIGHIVVLNNLVFAYKVRNKITHSELRMRQENGLWFCKKILSTTQYLYQFLDGTGEESPGAYAFRTYSFADLLLTTFAGRTVEEDAETERILEVQQQNLDDYAIRSDEDLNNWKFGNLRITKQEKHSILKNKIRKQNRSNK